MRRAKALAKHRAPRLAGLCLPLEPLGALQGKGADTPLSNE